MRLDWFGIMIVIKHPAVGRQLQCFKCGTLGHTIARCGYTAEQLRGNGCLVATEQEIVALDDVAKPFATLAEIKEAASLRRRIHHETAEVLTRTFHPHPTLEDRVASDLEARPTMNAICCFSCASLCSSDSCRCS